jgi:iron complex outermembrane receptor protein
MMRAVRMLVVVVTIGFPTIGWAQSGGITGTVRDDTGGAVPGARVAATGTAGAAGTKTTVTRSDGAFAIGGLVPGTYRVTVELPGFATETRQVTVDAVEAALEPIVLRIGDVSEIVVVSASKVETTVLNAPATMSVVTAETIANAPSQQYGDLLRNVPGLNVVQTSARDVNVTSRQAASTLATSQLVLVDGRSVYLDFFGFVAWDFVPTDPNDVQQIEVVRGPASAVWGANALTGVVNIITKSPRETPGYSFNLTGGGFSRDVGSRAGEGAGSTFGVSGSVSRAINDAFAYRVAAGYNRSDAFARPVGSVPLGRHPLDARVVTGGAAYPADGPGLPGQAFENTDTRQPRFDVRLDQRLAGGGALSYTGGAAGTSGIIHTGVGPFAIEPGAFLGYGRTVFSNEAFRVSAFVNLLDARSSNLLLTDPVTLRPLQLDFKTRTFDAEAGHATVVGSRNALSYGGNVRWNNFDEISIAPEAQNRTEIGAYLQDEVMLNRFRVTAGMRVDKFGNIDKAMVAPRVSVIFKPADTQSVRVSWNRAFRSPSAINNFLDLKLFAPVAPIDLRPLRPLLPAPLASLVPAQPVPLIVNAVGNRNLEPESLTAVEVAYTATIADRTTVGVAWYQNDTDENINFAQITPSTSFPRGIPPFDASSSEYVYTAANSAETGIPGALYGVLLQLGIPGFPLPRTVSTYVNLSPIRQRGIEFSFDHRLSSAVALSANYSLQATPTFPTADVDEIAYPPEETGLAARHRFNASMSWSAGRYLGSASLNAASRAFWVDVLGTPYAGYTDAYGMVNGSFGVKWLDGKMTTSIRVINLTNQTIQQHVFGDLMKRSIAGDLRLRF